MEDEIVFLPDHRGPDLRHVGLISAGFFVVVQLLFLDSLLTRVAFTVAFAVFLWLGLRLSGHSARTWPQKIVINRAGISYGQLKARHGIDLIPWREVDRMDLFYTDPRLPPHLRIGLRAGALCEQVRKTRLQRLSAGLDVNIPVSVNAPPEVVLHTAQQFWSEG